MPSLPKAIPWAETGTGQIHVGGSGSWQRCAKAGKGQRTPLASFRVWTGQSARTLSGGKEGGRGLQVFYLCPLFLKHHYSLFLDCRLYFCSAYIGSCPFQLHRHTATMNTTNSQRLLVKSLSLSFQVFCWPSQNMSNQILVVVITK